MFFCYEHAYSHQSRFKAVRPGIVTEVFQWRAESFNEGAKIPLKEFVNGKIFGTIASQTNEGLGGKQ